MKKNEEKSIKEKQNIHLNKMGFFKANWALLVLILLALIVIFALSYVVLVPYLNKKSLENDISNMETTSLISVQKVVCYSSAYGITNNETQARWNVNLSQYTDIAIYLNLQTNITNMYIDNISFSNPDIGNLSLSQLSAQDFGKSPIINPESSNNVENDNNENMTEINDNNLDAINEVVDRIDLDLALPITLRYLNYNIKENCLISDIETPLSFDGSILKRGKVTISSLKNSVSFTLHVIDSFNQEYTYPISIPINLENAEKEESIYDGSYVEEISFENARFFVNNQD